MPQTNQNPALVNGPLPFMQNGQLNVPLLIQQQTCHQPAFTAKSIHGQGCMSQLLMWSSIQPATGKEPSLRESLQKRLAALIDASTPTSHTTSGADRQI